MPTVDIIIPAYNAAHFLPRALNSVEAQTFTDWRIVLVDDGSRDNTSSVVAPYRERLGSKLLYIHKENGGLAAARNTAIRSSDAPLLALLDADDVWLPNRLQDTLAPFADPAVGLVYGFVQRIDADDRVLDTFATRNPHGEGDVARYIFMRTLDLPCPTVTFRRELAEAAGLFDETMRATEDRDLWLRIAQRSRVALAPHIVAYYRISPQAMTTDSERMLVAQRRFIDKHAGGPGCGWKERRIALGRVYRQRAETLLDQEKRGPALASILHGLAFDPFPASSWRAFASILLRVVGLKRQQRIDPSRVARLS